MGRLTTSKSIDGITDLVVWAPIREGFIDAFENITYETRLKLTAEAFHKVRVSAREYENIAPFPDTAERILTLLNFRIGIVDRDLFAVKPLDGGQTVIKPRRYMYLVATFDGPFEPYIRLIWRPLGPFLDLMLCNCESYVTADENSFDKYIEWIREHQLDSAIFYSTTGLTVKDQLYLSKLEKIQRGYSVDWSDRLIARMTSDDPDDLAEQVRTDSATSRESVRLALEALTVLFTLANYYPPDRADKDGKMSDGHRLLRVAKDLLHDWNPDALPPEAAQAYREPRDWFKIKLPSPNTPPSDNKQSLDESQVQKGLLNGYDQPEAPMTHGALLLMQITNPEKARTFLKLLEPNWEAGQAPSQGALAATYSDVSFNLALTFQGLERLQLEPGILKQFPREFRDGMAKRAPSFGDMHDDHPRRWSLPARYFPNYQGTQKLPPVELTEIDIAVQLRTRAVASKEQDEASQTSGNSSVGDTAASPLAKLIEQIAEVGRDNGVQLVAVEDMFRSPLWQPSNGSGFDPSAPPTTIEHFGFRDGLSQPVLTHDEDRLKPIENKIRIGDLLCGYRNSRGDAGMDNFLRNGSFMVVRKIAQDVKGFKDLLDRYSHLGREELAARLVGRRRDGTPLIQAKDNLFDYGIDPKGEHCPFASHIRLSNPRREFQGRPPPRIVRRGMSYGKRFSEDPEGPRGLVFMAYNASIAEQYEVIQRWLNGGNSTNVSAAQNDPLTGSTTAARPRTFRCIINNEVHRIELSKPLTKVEWGAYFFVPSRLALEEIVHSTPEQHPASVEVGNDLLRKIASISPEAQQLEWKVLLEDFLAKDPSEKNLSPQLWAALRARKGVYRVESGIAFGSANVPSHDGASSCRADEQKVVLVADHARILEVLSDDQTYSSKEQRRRAKASFGDIYVTQDRGSKYWEESSDTNRIIWEYSRSRQKDVYKLAYSKAEEVLNARKLLTADQTSPRFFELELNREFFMPTLGKLCKDWFDIPDGEYIELGGWGWAPVNDDKAPQGVETRKPRCPGDFMAPSRYAFYPRPTETIQEYGRSHGKALHEAAREIVHKMNDGGNIRGQISHPLHQAIVKGNDPEKELCLLARNLIGIMEGMLPPTNGILRGIIYDWLDEDKLTLWRHQAALLRATKSPRDSFEEAADALRCAVEEAMCARPAPDLIYRTATKDTELGGQKIEKDDLVILGLVSATQAALDAGKPDITPIFGGERQAVDQPEGTPLHACPAQDMVMASVLGILAALLASGRIEALPASLIVRISDYDIPPRPGQPTN